MRNLVITIGAPCSGKTTWIREQGVSDYSLSIDELRKYVSCYNVDLNGDKYINQDDDHLAWKLLFSILEERMQRGLFTVIDATHTMKKYLNLYDNLCKKYRYRLYGKKFDIDLELLYARNDKRERKISQNELKKHYTRLKVNYLPRKIQLIDNISDTNEILKFYPVEYKNIWFIGDIHGCYYNLLDKFIESNYSSDNLFVFIGDLLDRGPNNKEVLENAISWSKLDNFIFIEGNHDTHLVNWINDRPVRSKEFLRNTVPQIEHINKKDIRQFCRKLRQIVTFSHRDRTITACHGGIPSNKCISFIPTEQLIKGVGKYEDHKTIADNWNYSCDTNSFLVHGHRNCIDMPIKYGNVFNLENKIYDGGSLRAVKFSDEIYTYEHESPYIKENRLTNKTNVNIEILEKSNNIIKKRFGDITSYSFSRNVFNKGHWNDVTMSARGLFVNTKTSEIAARSYNKFFNLGEKNNDLQNILNNIDFPVEISIKENGFLGIVGVDNNRNVIYCSKSSLIGQFAYKVEEILSKYEFYFKEYPGNSFIFEIIDPVNDPHIIEYEHECAILLDVVKNSWNLEFQKDIFNEYDGEKKVFDKYVYNKQQLIEFVEYYINGDYELNIQPIEGWVLCGSNNFMTKIKTPYYSKWKYLRKQKAKCHRPDYIITNFAHDTESIEFLAWCRSLDEDYVNRASIIELRNSWKSTL